MRPAELSIACGERDHHVTYAHIAEIDDVVNHGALRRGEGAFALALHGHLLQFLARGEQACAIGGAARQNEPADMFAEGKQRREQNRRRLENAARARRAR